MKIQKSRKEERLNKLMTAFYDYIGECHIDNICAETENLKEEIDKIEIPETLDERVYRYINSVKGRKSRQRFIAQFRNTSSRVAVILLALLFSLITLTLSVEAFRVHIYNLFFTDHKEFSNVKTMEISDENNAISGWSDYYFPAYIPEGFYIKSAREIEGIRVIKFVNDDNEYIYFIQTPNGTEMSLDTESGEKREVKVNDKKALLTQKGDKNILIWNNEEFSFHMTSNLDEKS
ncbi:DUF4367 domain-containing protein [Thermoclostridium stercorarium]|uniref:DUF4367 domain-containing protein n=1 Tax=Thermoclostridium stercorarium TaxID=1510 RepID=UPI002248F0B4|nr:DUF4367 domain-containing protein [Thermoclostridium stercorarium]UZQ85498.1 DUF4367 domain-containing protein [Thermoclostridium stercorarium]